jgi:hypothetical protein
VPYRLQDYGALGAMVCRREPIRRWSITKIVTPPYDARRAALPEKRTVVLDHTCP